ncbi:hypothetical protein DFH08DRAFT_957859 [Mycena albidolilacea]|uniref:Uncharacterized protein n=1 Tax=Mycena albidolilacea TaxID=1033008 RepID=A0AAD7A8S7_9AGAR|nr:hypothetical protein DFH08DRAFT_957859 [Mycena albidolilacea]
MIQRSLTYASHRFIFSFRNPNTRLFSVYPARISALAPLERPSTHAHATARGASCECVPCGVDHDLHILRWLAYTPLFSFQRPAMRSSTRTGMQILSRQVSVSYPSAIDTPCARLTQASARILARVDAHDLHARLSVPPNMPPTAALFSVSSSSTSSFVRSHPTHIAGCVLLHAYGNLPPFPVRDATLEFAPFTRTVLCVPGRGHAGAYMDLDEHRPSPSTTRFVLPFLSWPSSSALLRLFPLFFCARRLCVLGACAFAPLLLICAPHASPFRPPAPPLRLALSLSSSVSIYQHARH